MTHFVYRLLIVNREKKAPLLFFPRKKIAHMRKIQKHNMNKIYQIEPRLKEMTCFMTIVENAILAPSNPSLNITGITFRKI